MLKFPRKIKLPRNSALTDFEKAVLAWTATIPTGKITTYQVLAKALGMPRAARAVGNALHKNPWVPKVPCHRVVKSDGYLGGYGRGVRRKVWLLKREGIQSLPNGKIINFKKVFFTFK